MFSTIDFHKQGGSLFPVSLKTQHGSILKDHSFSAYSCGVFLLTKVDHNHNVMFCPTKVVVVYHSELTKSAMFATCIDSLMTSRRERPGRLSN